MFEFSTHYKRLIQNGWGLAILALCYFMFTMAQGLLWFDSGELALAAHSWGLGHPPGQVFYTMLGAWTTWLPGSALYWLNLLSALSIALSIPALYKILHHANFEKNTSTHLVMISWIFLYPVWDQATRIEVYALACCSGLWAIAYWLDALNISVVHEGSKPIEMIHRENDTLLNLQVHGAKIKKAMACSAWAWAICAGSNLIFAVGFGISIILSWVMKRPKFFKTWIIHAILAFSIFHIYYLYCIFFSQGFVWGQHQSIQDLLYFFTGKDYRHTVHDAWHLVPTHIYTWLKWSFYHGTLLWAILGFLGLFISTTRAYLIYILPISFLSGIFPLSYQNYWPEVPDFNGYILPILALSILCIVGIVDKISKVQTAIVISLLLLASTFVSIQPPHHRTRQTHHLALTLAHDWLHHLPAKSVVFVQSDHWIFPLLYAQEVQKVRPDIILFNMGFAKSSWYWQWLARKHEVIKRVNYQHSSRIKQLVEILKDRPLYAESVDLSLYLSQDIGCTAYWGISLKCKNPLKLPDSTQVRQWAQHAAHQDDITPKVLSAMVWSLSLNLWMQRRSEESITLAYAALGKKVPSQVTLPIPWWPAPTTLWQTPSQALISSPETLEVILEILTGQRELP